MKKKSMWIIGSIVVIALIVVIGVAIKIVIGGNSKGVYGNRLDGIENYAISDSKIEEIKTKILENKECEKIKKIKGLRKVSYIRPFLSFCTSSIPLLVFLSQDS